MADKKLGKILDRSERDGFSNDPNGFGVRKSIYQTALYLSAGSQKLVSKMRKSPFVYAKS